jgi:carboxyl-terminal processing protease
MKYRAVVAAILLSSPAAFAANCPGKPASAFEALPPDERNLAVYDAFWQNIEKNHYDPQMLSRAEVRALRERGRNKAATAGHPANLYGQVFSDITRVLPESRVKVELPRAADSSTVRRRYSKSPEEAQRLADALFGEAGFDQATIRRGSRNIRVVTEVRPDSPAQQAGIRPGWRVVSFNANKDARRNALQFSGEFLPLDPLDAFAWERGDMPLDPPDSRKVLKIEYAHRPLPARRPIEHRNVGDDVRYVRFDDFGDDEFMKPVYQALREAGPDGLIIDLRWNGGGELRQAQKLAGVLLGDVVMGFQQDARGSEAIRALRPFHRYQGPLAVLIGPGSSSASEILAAAIKDHRRGKLVGRMTNGSLLSSDVFPLPDGGLVTVPTRDFRSASNRRLEGVGVAPDVRVLPTLEDVRAGRDATLERAVQLIRASANSRRPTPDFRRRDELYPPI